MAVQWLLPMLLNLIALSLQAGANSLDCSSTFPSVSELIAPSRPTVALPVLQLGNNVQQWIFPGLRFSCSGNLTSWIFRAENSSSQFATNTRPRFEVWFENEDTEAMDFIRRHAAIEELELLRYDSPDDPVYEYRLPAPIAVEENDLLGLFFPATGQFESLRMLFLDMGEGNASTSYHRNVNNELFLIENNLVRTDNAHVPLVSAVFVSPEVTTTVAIQPTPTTQRMSATGAAQTPSGTPRPPTELLPVIAIAVGVSVGGVVLAAVTVLIIVTAVACARKKSQNPTDRSVDAINMTATAEETYDYPFHEPTAVATKHNEAYATTAITTEQNEAYVTTAITTEQNEAYASSAITTEQNEAYVSTAITTEQNEAYVTAITACTVAPNKAYGTTGNGDTATDVYDYTQ